MVLKNFSKLLRAFTTSSTVAEDTGGPDGNSSEQQQQQTTAMKNNNNKRMDENKDATVDASNLPKGINRLSCELHLQSGKMQPFLIFVSHSAQCFFMGEEYKTLITLALNLFKFEEKKSTPRRGESSPKIRSHMVFWSLQGILYF
jgi:hypothetical protein